MANAAGNGVVTARSGGSSKLAQGRSKQKQANKVSDLQGLRK